MSVGLRVTAQAMKKNHPLPSPLASDHEDLQVAGNFNFLDAGFRRDLRRR